MFYKLIIAAAAAIVIAQVFAGTSLFTTGAAKVAAERAAVMQQIDK